jgi:molybdopterin molybdotransferase
MALSIDEARAHVLAATPALPSEDVAVTAALGRVLAEDVASEHDVPAFVNSAMDGFAVRSGPAGRRLRLVGEARAGAPATVAVGDGDAVRISTGAAVPEGADAVLQVEHATLQDGSVVADVDLDSGTHLRHPGEDLRRGAVVVPAGTRMGAAELGVCVSAGRAVLRCARRPRVIVLATGDELVEPGGPLEHGQLHNSNGITLASLATLSGAEVLRNGVVRDSEQAAREAIAAALGEADVVVLSGGVSVGPHDHVKPALIGLGVQEGFWRVALRPGGPTWFGTRGDTLVFGLPGNPVSAMVTFLLFVRPALAKLQGAEHDPDRITARLSADVPRTPRRHSCIRVTLREGLAVPTGPQGSHQLSSMLGAEGLAIVPAGEGMLPEGTEVTVERLETGLR